MFIKGKKRRKEKVRGRGEEGGEGRGEKKVEEREEKAILICFHYEEDGNNLN